MKHVGLSNAKPQHRGSSHRPCPGNKRPAPLRIPRSAAAPAAALPGAARRRAWGQRRRVPGTAPVRTPRAEVPRRPLCSVPAAQAPARRPLPSPCRRRRRCRCRYAGSARSPPAGSGGTDRSPGSWRAPGAPRLPPGPGRGGARRGAARRERPRPARLRRRSQSPGCTPRPPPTTTSRPASPPPAAAPSRVTPTRRGARPQPLAPGAAPTWLPPAAPPALTPVPGPRATAQPPSRRSRAPGGPCALPACAPVGSVGRARHS